MDNPGHHCSTNCDTCTFRSRGRFAACDLASAKTTPRIRALIVDDSRFIRQHLRHLLERIGVNCEEATDGREALRMLEASAEFDLMLLDINMPGMDGLECVQAVRNAGLHPPMKVMMVTTEADHSCIRRALECGADEFLMKPFTPESLRQKLAMLGCAA